MDDKADAILEALIQHPKMAYLVREKLMGLVQFVGPWEDRGGGQWVLPRHLPSEVWSFHEGLAEEISIAAKVEEMSEGRWQCEIFRHNSDSIQWFDRGFTTASSAMNTVDAMLEIGKGLKTLRMLF